MSNLAWYLEKYGESHQNSTNKRIHFICVPAIMFSLFGLLMAIPFPLEKTMYFNWAALLLLGALMYYLRLSTMMFLGFLVIGALLLWGNYALFEQVGRSGGGLALVSLAIFVLAWIGQFIGHKIEGKKPSFLEDVQFLLIGPAWLLHFLFKQVGIKY